MGAFVDHKSHPLLLLLRLQSLLLLLLLLLFVCLSATLMDARGAHSRVLANHCDDNRKSDLLQISFSSFKKKRGVDLSPARERKRERREMGRGGAGSREEQRFSQQLVLIASCGGPTSGPCGAAVTPLSR